MMPDVHLGAVEHVLEWADVESQIGMGEVTDERVQHTVPEHDNAAETEECRGDIKQASIEHDFSPVKSPVPNPVHFLDAVMHLVESPQERYSMKCVVNEPLRKVESYEKHEELKPYRLAAHGAHVKRLAQMRKIEASIERGDCAYGD